MPDAAFAAKSEWPLRRGKIIMAETIPPRQVAVAQPTQVPDHAHDAVPSSFPSVRLTIEYTAGASRSVFGSAAICETKICCNILKDTTLCQSLSPTNAASGAGYPDISPQCIRIPGAAIAQRIVARRSPTAGISKTFSAETATPAKGPL
jgi:hypothetical protein